MGIKNLFLFKILCYNIPIQVGGGNDKMQYSDDMKKRLRRIEGQARGVFKMMEEEKDCKEVIHQLSAIRAAADKAVAYIIAKNMEHCLFEQLEKGESPEEVIQSAVELMVKSR